MKASPEMWQGNLYPIELKGVRNAVEKRLREFTAGRNCARAALAQLGLGPIPIPIGSDRAPVFPPQVSCSITHTSSYCAAAAIIRGEVDSLGIDAEENTVLDADLIDIILSGQELAAFEHSKLASCNVLKLAFSAKEAFYKAYYQQMRSWLDFRDVVVAFNTRTRTFQITIVSNADQKLLGRSFEGNYAVDAERVYCAIALASLVGPV